jgi:arylsulfatase A-like enzyme
VNSADATPERSRPDLVLWLVDALRADHCSLYGYERRTTPSLERLAQDSVVFDNAYSVSTWTKPVAASILSGAYPAEHCVRTYRDLYRGHTRWLPETLQRSGYATCGVSSIGNVSTAFGFAHGFDSFVDLYRDNSLMQSRETSTAAEWRLSGDGAAAVVLPLAEDVAERACRWLESRPAGRPCFLFLWTMDTHTPYSPPPDFRHFLDPSYSGHVDGSELSVRRARKPADVQRLIDLYDGEVAYADNCLGEFMRRLKDAGMYDNAMLVVASDHGEAFGEHGDFVHGHLPFEEVARVPLLLKLPGNRLAGRRVVQLASLVDIMPTVLDYLGIEAGTGEQPVWRGRSLGPAMETDEAVHEQVFFETQATVANPAIRGLRSRSWKYVRIERSGSLGGSIRGAVRSMLSRASLRKILANPLFYVRRRLGQARELLFDLQADPEEHRNVARERLDALERARQTLNFWLQASDGLARGQDLGVHGPSEADEETLQHLRALGYID